MIEQHIAEKELQEVKRLADEKELRLRELAQYSDSTISTMKKSTIKTLFSEHLNNKESKERYNGRTISNLKQEQLIDYALYTVGEARKRIQLEKGIASDGINIVNPDDLQVSSTSVVFKFKEGYKPERVASECCNVWDESLKKEKEKEKKDDTVTEGLYTEKTLSSKISKTLKNIKNQLPDNKEAELWFGKLEKIINTHYYRMRKKLRDERNQKMDKYGDEILAIIDARPVIEFINHWSKTYLQSDYKPTKNWHVASWILALTSGRRQCEIHGDATYQKTEDGQLKTVGLAKKKDKQTHELIPDFEHISPIAIIDVDTWLAIYDKLPEERKNLDRDTVNKVISRAMNDNVTYKQALQDFNFKNLTDHKKPWGNYHNARDFYINYMIRKRPFHSQHRPIEDSNYATKLVSHEGKVTGLNYNKMRVTHVEPEYEGE